MVNRINLILVATYYFGNVNWGARISCTITMCKLGALVHRLWKGCIVCVEHQFLWLYIR